MDIVEINSEIQKLQELRQQALSEKQNEIEQHIKSLSWTKDCDAILEINPLSAMGLPKYKIFLLGEIPKFDIFSKYQCTSVMGDHGCYEFNMMYGKQNKTYSYNYEDYCFYTSCDKRLLAFLEIVEFKSLDYNKTDWEVLNAARNKSLSLENS